MVKCPTTTTAIPSWNSCGGFPVLATATLFFPSAMVKSVPTAVGWIDPSTTSPSRLKVRVPRVPRWAKAWSTVSKKLRELPSPSTSRKTNAANRTAKTSHSRLLLRRRARGNAGPARWASVDGPGEGFGSLMVLVTTVRRGRPAPRRATACAGGSTCGAGSMSRVRPPWVSRSADVSGPAPVAARRAR